MAVGIDHGGLVTGCIINKASAVAQGIGRYDSSSGQIIAKLTAMVKGVDTGG